jgi:hypothetical protein
MHTVPNKSVNRGTPMPFNTEVPFEGGSPAKTTRQQTNELLSVSFLFTICIAFYLEALHRISMLQISTMIILHGLR